MKNQPTQTSMEHRSDSPQDPYKWQALGLAALIGITPIFLFAVGWYGTASLQSPSASRAALVATPGPSGIPAQLVSGATVYKNTCAVCHGTDGQGVARLGKPLRNSAYVQGASDEELFQLIADGRLPDDPKNTTGTLMPARGAQNISDESIMKVIAFMHEMQDPSQPTASVDDWDLKAQMLESASASDGEAHPGMELFVSSCSACHGAHGEGIEGLGKPFTTSDFVSNSSDKELMTMIKMGRPIWDPANTTGIDMPPKGGNPALSDEELTEIIGYIRSVSDSSSGTAADAAIVSHPGREIFISSCSACHGANGEGIEGLGKSFVTSEFVQSSTDKELMTMIKMGRPIWDAANTTGIDMPPKGGNPALSDEELTEIIGYIRSVSTAEN